MALRGLTLDQLIQNSVNRYPDNIAITWKDQQFNNAQIFETEQKLKQAKRQLRKLQANGLTTRLKRKALEKKIQYYQLSIERQKWQGLTYEMLYEYLTAFATGLRNLGLEKNDRIAILSDNSPQWLIAALGVNWLGGITVPLPPQILQKKPKALISTNKPLLEHNEPKAIVIDQLYYDMIVEENPSFFDDVGSLEKIIIIERGPMQVRSLEKLEVAELEDKLKSQNNLFYMNEVLHNGAITEQRVKPNNSENDIATIVYTSGTTGNSVGVMHTHRSIFSNVLFTAETFPIDNKSRMLSTAPFAHVLGLLLCGYTVFYKGARYVLYSSLKNIANDVRETKTTHLVSFPQLYTIMFNRVRSEIDSDRLKRTMLRLIPEQLRAKLVKDAMGFATVKYFVSGGAKLSEETWHTAKKLGIYILEGYGLTEAPVCSVTPPSLKQYGGTVGIPLRGVNPEKLGFASGVNLKDYRDLRRGVTIGLEPVELQSSTGVIVTAYEVVVSGAHVTLGFYKEKGKTTDVIYESEGERMLRTGDLGVFVDAAISGVTQRLLKLAGRKKSVIVLPNGKNLDPEEIEGLITSHCSVVGACRLVESDGGVKLKVMPNYRAPEIREFYRKHNLVLRDPPELPAESELRELLRHLMLTRLSPALEHVPPYVGLSTRYVELVSTVGTTWTGKVKRH